MIASKQWSKTRSKSYDDLLKDFKIPTHEKRRSDARLVILFKIIHKYCYFPGNIFNFITLPLHHNLHSLTLNPPFTRTNAFTYSFVPFTIKLWNQLDSTTVSASSVQSFEYLLRQYTVPSISETQHVRFYNVLLFLCPACIHIACSMFVARMLPTPMLPACMPCVLPLLSLFSML